MSLDFSKDVTDKLALDNLIEEFQAVAATVEHLHFLNKPNINFLMSLHSKMNAIKMPFFYSCSYPLLPNALAPFNILALAVVNNGTSLVEFALVEPPYLERATDDDHEALVLRYIAAFGSRLDSFNMMGRKFRFRFPREWAARFVKLPEIARFLDRAGARGCDVWCRATFRVDCQRCVPSASLAHCSAPSLTRPLAPSLQPWRSARASASLPAAPSTTTTTTRPTRRRCRRSPRSSRSSAR